MSTVCNGDTHVLLSLTVGVALLGQSLKVVMDTIIEWGVFHHGVKMRQRHSLALGQWLCGRESGGRGGRESGGRGEGTMMGVHWNSLFRTA